MTKTVEMITNAGTMRIELDDVKAPVSVANFLAYAAKGHYDNTVFHRVIKGVDKIKAVPTGNKGPHQNVPLEPVTIKKASLEK